MEKRALLAVILSLLVVFLYQVFFLPSPEERRAAEPSEEEIPAPSPKPPAPIVREALAPPQLVAPEREEGEAYVVESDLIRMEIGPTGARIRKLDLKKYRTHVEEESPPIDLVTMAGEEGGIPLAFFLEERGDGKVTYRTDEEYVRVAGERGITLAALRGGWPRREYTFREGSYLWDLRFRYRGTGDVPLTLITESQMVRSSGHRFRDEVAFTEIVANVAQDVERYSIKKLKEPKFYTEGVQWVGFENKYFLFSLIPPTGSELRISRMESPEGERGVILLRLPPGERSVSVYAGPKDIDVLAQAGVELERAVSLGWFGFIARPLLALLKWFHQMVGNYGVAIIILTVLIKILFYPLTQMSMKSMKRMQGVQPKMMEIKEKHKDDRERMNREIMELYRREKVNPAGGCLPILIQIPIFIALYQALMYSIEIRHAPFVWWINDLSAPEDLFAIPLGGFSIPIRLLPLVMGASMFLQQKLSPQAGDPRQAQIMMLMPIVFTFMFWGFPSGLVLYWLVNNILSILQQAVVNRGTKEPAPQSKRRRRLS